MIKVIIELDELDNSREYSKSKILLNKLHNDNPDISVEIRKESERYNESSKFKRGDILHSISTDVICIFDKYVKLPDNKNSFNAIYTTSLLGNTRFDPYNFRYATGEEKEQFILDLINKGKRYNSDTCEIEELKPEFKHGDILYFTPIDNSLLVICDKITDNNTIKTLYEYPEVDSSFTLKYEDFRLATNEEKQILFKQLERDNLKWNAEKCKMEKLQPKFKRGDIIYDIASRCICIFNKYIDINNYHFESIYNIYNSMGVLDYGWSAHTFRLATEEEKQVLFKQLAKEGKQWNAEICKLEDLKWKPKDKEKYFYPDFKPYLSKFYPYSTVWADFILDKQNLNHWHIFKTEEECQKKCDELNEKIKH